MNSLIINLFRVVSLTIYPLILTIFIFSILKNKSFISTIKRDYKKILINTAIIVIIGIISLFIFFSIEDTIYNYDYSGGWIRVLELKRMFLENPGSIFSFVYNSMNYDEYSYLPALLMLPFMIFGSGSYLQFCLVIFITFIIPLVLYLQIIYFNYFKSSSFLPIFIFVAFYPIYYIIFFGEVDVVGFFLIIFLIYTLFIKDFDDIDKLDISLINLSTFLLLFLRRYYLYFVFFMYILFLLKVLYTEIYLNKKKVSNVLIKTISTGIFSLIIILLFFNQYVINVLGNNFSEAYQMYDHDGKIFDFINFYSLPIIVISILGIIYCIKNKKYILVSYLVLSIILTCLLFWRIQSFEAHHYSLISMQILLLFSLGLIYIKNNFITIILIILLIFQSCNIYLNIIPSSAPIITSLRKAPTIYSGKSVIQEFSNYLYSITKDEGMYAYFATGDNNFSADIVSNSNLPNIYTTPKIYDNVLDIRDGFPDLNNIAYIIITAPTVYLNKDYQHNYEIITNAIRNVPSVSKSYKQIYESYIGDMYVEVFQKIDNLSKEAKIYLYDEITKVYPDKKEEYKYIVN